MSGLDNVNSDEHAVYASTNNEKHRSFFRKVLSSIAIAFGVKSTSRGLIAWQGFKCFVFLICLTYLLKQSAEFYKQFSTYPTNIKIRWTSLSTINIPATTLCYRNRISAAEFCRMYPNLCEKPKNVEEYCQKHPLFCPRNISTLEIPKHGYHSNFSTEVSKMSQQILFNRSDDFPETGTRYMTGSSKVTFFSISERRYAKCYSENLHLFQSKENKSTEDVDVSGISRVNFYNYDLSLHEEESFDPSDGPQAYFAVHSPFSPSYPMDEGHALKSGFNYVVEVKLEEYHLLPHPYQTNCTNYDVQIENLKEKKPRSQEMCKEMCRSEFFNKLYGCDRSKTMLFKEDICNPSNDEYTPSSKSWEELSGIRKACVAGCNPDCVKLVFPYTVVETENERDPETGLKERNTLINVYAKFPDVKIMSHDPLYTDGELFSYIGGLVGCWLGISVWTFTGIFEKCMLKVAAVNTHYRKKKGSHVVN